ncbi:type II toxin-antitoxin system RelE/ParE family toxin [Franconibacter daqui]|uniref:type II toxin-antitoxin system RelE/ParE family toxin n=1 Tax=Franconibacter daqui TaxID=2047724 RepID=UPI002DBCDBC5|nr:type II toxin-antitoxin system RelE/ParE family toxin [Franconibacter daqui]
MRRVTWKEQALNDLANILDYIEQQNPVASRKLLEQMMRVADSLPSHPSLYRSGRVPGTREAVVHPHYVLIYRESELQTEILRVLHTRREYP